MNKLEVFKNNEWLEQQPSHGEKFRETVNGDVIRISYWSEPNKETIERDWRDSEILRTDKLVVLPDYPVDLLGYRVELRDYPQQADFPNGLRPTESN